MDDERPIPDEATVASDKRPTIRDVAARAGVSPMTVSRTLAGNQTVNEQLRQKVVAAVVELGYHRNENARSLRPGHSSGLIGVAITNVANPYYGTFTQGIEEVVSRTGRRILLGNTQESPVLEEQLTNDFLGRRVDGLIVVPTGMTWRHLEQAQAAGVPVVIAAREVPDLEVASVLVDDEGGAYSGTMALLDDGHRNIAFLGNTPNVATSARRYRGFAAAFDDKGVVQNPDLVTPGQQDVESASMAMRALLDLEPRPTAVFCANNRNAVGAVTEIARQVSSGQLDLENVPSVLSFDDFELSNALQFPVSVIEHDSREMGRIAARLLLAQMSGSASGTQLESVVVPTKLRHSKLAV